MSLEPLAGSELAAIVTYLEMASRPEISFSGSPLSLRLLEQPATERYRELFRLVGARWLWFSRLIMEDAELQRILQDPRVELFVVEDSDRKDAGILELDFRQQGECELAFVGLVPELSGKGHGRWLLEQAVDRAWREGVSRIHVHTCSLDHPAALSAYCRAGFHPFKRAIERFPDPRLAGILPRDCAPQVPLLGTLG